MNSHGHVDITYSGAEHYTGSAVMHVTMQGKAADLISRFEGRWLKADCGGITH
jgi:hypothetical protein